MPLATKRLWIVRAGLILLFAAYAALLACYVGAYAGGSDSSGYLNLARLLHEGRMHAPQRVVTGIPPGTLSSSAFMPLGFTEAAGDRLAPTYPVGLPLLIVGVSYLTGWDAAPHVTIWLHGLFGVLLMFALARAAGLGAIAAALGALLLAASPLYLSYSVQAMSDAPALVWCTAAVYFAWLSRQRGAWALAAGVSVAIAVLVRPSDLLVLLPVGVCLGLAWRRWLGLVVGGIPGAVFLGFLNRSLYGKVLTTGYGDVSHAFSVDNILPALAHYARWMPVLLTPGIVLVFALPWVARREPPRLVAALAAWIAVFFGFYTLYFFTHETWWYLRFLLPAFPALIMVMLLAGRTLAARWSPAARCVAAGVVAVTAVLWDGYWAHKKNVLTSGDGERSYLLASQWVRAHLPENAVLGVMQCSGALFYYTDFTLLRYDLYEPHGASGAFPALQQAAAASGRPIYSVLYPFELKEALEKRLPGRWTQVGAARDWSIWRFDGPEATPVTDHPWHELDTGRVEGAEVTAEAADGWYGAEGYPHRVTTWCTGRGTLIFESHPQVTSTLQFEFTLRSLAPCHVTVTQDGTTLWQGAVDRKPIPVRLTFPLRSGQARLEFATDTPAAPETASPGSRGLAFAICDPLKLSAAAP